MSEYYVISRLENRRNRVTTKHNYGDIKTWDGISDSNKCFFLAIAGYFSTDDTEINRLALELVQRSGLLKDEKVNLFNFTDDSFENKHCSIIEGLFRNCYPLSHIRVEIYFGNKVDFVLYTNSDPVYVFNRGIKNRTCRILLTTNPDHFELITTTDGFFAPELLDAPDDLQLLQQIKTEQLEIMEHIMKEKMRRDEEIARELQLEEQRQFYLDFQNKIEMMERDEEYARHLECSG